MPRDRRRLTAEPLETRRLMAADTTDLEVYVYDSNWGGDLAIEPATVEMAEIASSLSQSTGDGRVDADVRGLRQADVDVALSRLGSSDFYAEGTPKDPII